MLTQGSSSAVDFIIIIIIEEDTDFLVLSLFFVFSLASGLHFACQNFFNSGGVKRKYALQQEVEGVLVLRTL